MSTVSSGFIFATVGMIRTASDDSARGTIFESFIQICFSLGVFGLLVILPLILLPFSGLGSLFVFVIEVVLYLLYRLTLRMSVKTITNS